MSARNEAFPSSSFSTRIFTVYLSWRRHVERTDRVLSFEDRREGDECWGRLGLFVWGLFGGHLRIGFPVTGLCPRHRYDERGFHGRKLTKFWINNLGNRKWDIDKLVFKVNFIFKWKIKVWIILMEFYWSIVFFLFCWNIRRINCFDVFCEWNKFVDEKRKDYLYPFFK